MQKKPSHLQSNLFWNKVNQPIQFHPCISSKSGRKHSQVLIKYLFLALAFFEVPSWCLNPSRDQGSCLTREGLYSWNIPLLPFQVSNAMLGKTSVCVCFFFFSSASLEVATTIFQKWCFLSEDDKLTPTIDNGGNRKPTNRTKKWWLNFQGVLLQPFSPVIMVLWKMTAIGEIYPFFHRTMSMGGSGHVATFFVQFHRHFGFCDSWGPHEKPWKQARWENLPKMRSIIDRVNWVI